MWRGIDRRIRGGEEAETDVGRTEARLGDLPAPPPSAAGSFDRKLGAHRLAFGLQLEIHYARPAPQNSILALRSREFRQGLLNLNCHFFC